VFRLKWIDLRQTETKMTLQKIVESRVFWVFEKRRKRRPIFEQSGTFSPLS